MAHGAELAALTAAKTVANTALRWVSPFLATLERALGTTVGTLTGVMGLAELGGLSTAAAGRFLDRGHQRRLFVAGLGAIALSGLLACVGSVLWFGIAFTVLVIGVANATVAGHAWISQRVPYVRRARSIGIFELSWALALLLGAPAVAVIIGAFGWRGPFLAISVLCLLAMVLVLVMVPPDVVAARGTVQVAAGRLGSTAWRVLVASSAIAAAGMAIFVVSGAWLSDRHGVPTAGLGLVAALFGAVELLASGSTAVWADRLGKRASVRGGLVLLGLGLALCATSGDAVWLAVGGLTVFLAGFEFAFVSSLSMVSEAAPHARGRALGLSNSIGTLARASALLLTGQLYDRVGLGGSLLLSAGAAALALVLLPGARRLREERLHPGGQLGGM